MKQLVTLGGVISNGLDDWRVWLLHVLANSLLFALFVGWLFIPESHNWQLGLSLLSIIALVAAGLVLHAGTLSYFAERYSSSPAPLRTGYVRALRHVLAFAICVLFLYVVWLQVGRLDAYQRMLPAYLRSTMPVQVRRHVSRAAISGAYQTAIFVLRWIVVPGVLLPFAAAVAHFGFQGLLQGPPAAWRAVRTGVYWLAIAVAAVAGVLLSSHLVAWRPLSHGATLSRETASMALRFAIAYLVVLASWLMTCSFLGWNLKSCTGG
jgi:hypothetical protein